MALDFNLIKSDMLSAGMTTEQYNREVSFAKQTIASKVKIKECVPNSILAAVKNTALIGLSLNPIHQEASLTSRWDKTLRKNVCVLTPEYKGLLKLMTELDTVNNVVTENVYEKDFYEYVPTDSLNPFIHKVNISLKDRGQLLGCYALVTLSDGTKMAEWVSKEELEQIRECSDSYKYYVKQKKAGNYAADPVWVKWEKGMNRKSAIKRVYKYVPKGKIYNKIAEAIALDNTDYTVIEEPKQLPLTEPIKPVLTKSHSKYESVVKVIDEQKNYNLAMMLEHYTINEPLLSELQKIEADAISRNERAKEKQVQS